MAAPGGPCPTLLGRHQTAVTLGFRFVYGFRTVTPFVLGMSGMGTSRFAAVDALAALSWAGVVATGGFLFGHALEALMSDLKKLKIEAMAVVAGIGAAIWICRILKRRLGG